jgi:hypothetical protein
MLHDLKELIGASVLATDGEIGSIRNFLLDDRSWMICYVVVDVGPGISAAMWCSRSQQSNSPIGRSAFSMSA